MSQEKSKIKYEQKSVNIEFRDFRSGKKLQFRPHFHSEIELVYMIEGEVAVCADSKRSVLRAGDTFLVFPNQIHFYQSYACEKYLLFIIKPELMPEFAEIFSTGVPTSPVIQNAASIPRVKQLLSLLAEVCSTEQENMYINSMQRGYLLALFSELLSHISISRPSTGDSGALRTVVSYCSKNYSDDLSLGALQEKLHVSKYYISHLFSDKLKLRFNDYVHLLRISEACKLLNKTDQSITEICGQVGFNSLRTFNRIFSQHMGVSPSEYRKQKNSSVNS